MSGLDMKQVHIYIKAVDSGKIEKRPLDGMQGLARLAVAQDEELAQLKEALKKTQIAVQSALLEAQSGAAAAQQQMEAHLITFPAAAGIDGTRAAVHQRYVHLLTQIAATLNPAQDGRK